VKADVADRQPWTQAVYFSHCLGQNQTSTAFALCAGIANEIK